jgi:hypothetical protein
VLSEVGGEDRSPELQCREMMMSYDVTTLRVAYNITSDEDATELIERW